MSHPDNTEALLERIVALRAAPSEPAGDADIAEVVRGAARSATALQKLRQKDYSLVISDWNMEPMTGLQLLKEVRTDTKLKGMPFIMITAESKTENVVAAKQAGVSNYIVKPFNAATLKQKLSSVIGSF